MSSNAPGDLKYTKDHEWVKIDGSTALVGVTEFAQSELGEIVFVDLPTIGKTVTQGQSFCVLESTKAASDVYAPISGTVKAVNAVLSDEPTKVNGSPYGDGWLVRLENVNQAELSKLLTSDEYKKHINAA